MLTGDWGRLACQCVGCIGWEVGVSGLSVCWLVNGGEWLVSVFDWGVGAGWPASVLTGECW